MASISDLAEQLAINLPVILADRDLTADDLDRLAKLPPGLTARLINCDPSTYPCPRQWHRICLALGTTSQELLAE